MPELTRRFFTGGSAALAATGLAGCSGSGRSSSFAGDLLRGFPFGSGGGVSGRTLSRPDYARIYARLDGERHPVPAFRYAALDPDVLRREVAYTGPGEPGTLVVDPKACALYHVGRGRTATRYGVGVGRDGFVWSGEARINMKRDWPDWVPPREMVARDPGIRAQLVDTPRGLGVPGGPRSPLGARAMYLFADGDTGYRIHGTTEPETIGTHVSSGCIRMVNQDVIHLYHRTSEGARVLVLA